LPKPATAGSAERVLCMELLSDDVQVTSVYSMFDFAKFGSSDWPASPDVLNRHPYKHDISITTTLIHSFSELRTNKQTNKNKRKNPSDIIVKYFFIP
jgi:hypothetical protein